MPRRESKAANHLMLYALLLAASYILMRSVGDSLFLSRVGSESLAAVFVASGIATALLASSWYWLTRHVSLATSVRLSGGLSAALTLSAWVALPYLHHTWWLLAAIYVLTELKGCVNSINVVTATNEILGGHSSRNAWTRIGLGAPLAGVVIGLLISLEASFVDVRTWLFLSACLDLLAILPLINVSRLVVPKAAHRKTGSLGRALSATANRLKKYACSQQFLFWIGTLIAAKVVVLTLVTFFWKVSVNDYFDGNEQSLTQYFGSFYAAFGLLTLLLQGFVTGRLLSRRSLYVPILVMPIGLSVLGAAIAFGSGALFMVVVLTLAKSLEAWRRSVHDTTLGFLYTKIERTKRRSAISFNTAFVKPVAEVCASLLLLFSSTFVAKSFLLIAAAIWIVATIVLLRLVTRIGKQMSHSTKTRIDATRATQKPCSEPA